MSRTMMLGRWTERADRGTATLLCVAAPLLVLTFMPPHQYDWSGHETGFGALLEGGAPDPDDNFAFGVQLVPTLLARGLSLLPFADETLRGLWIALNRGALAAVLWGVGLVTQGLAAEPVRARAVALAVLVAPPLLAWSVTAYFVVPALALGILSVAAAQRGRAGLALALGALALGSRLETASLLLAALLLTRYHPAPRPARAIALPGLTALAATAAFVVSRWDRLPLAGLLPPRERVVEGLLLLPESLPSVAWLVPLALLGQRAPRLFLPAALAALGPCWLLDPGARHLLPLALLLVPLAASPPRSGGAARIGRRLADLWTVLVALASLTGLLALPARYDPERYGFSTAEVRQADAGGPFSLADLAQADCVLLLPGGGGNAPGLERALDAETADAITRARVAGGCVALAVGSGARFSGDCRRERFDRAVALLDLEPAGWIEHPPGGELRWMLWATPGNAARTLRPLSSAAP